MEEISMYIIIIYLYINYSWNKKEGGVVSFLTSL